MTTERIGTMNVQGGLSDRVALGALNIVAPECDLLALQEWGPNRGDVIRSFRSAHKGWRYIKPLASCPPLLYRDTYLLIAASVVTLDARSFVGRIVGRRSWFPDVEAGLYVLADATGDEVVLLNWHLPPTVEARGIYRRAAGALTLRASKHRRCKRKARRALKPWRRAGARVYVVGDTNYHLMRFRPYVSCWDGRDAKGTHGRRTIDIIFARTPCRQGPRVRRRFRPPRSHRHLQHLRSHHAADRVDAPEQDDPQGTRWLRRCARHRPRYRDG